MMPVPGCGWPKLVIDNKDVVFTTDQDRKRFAKQIDVTHLLYAGETGDFMQKKREERYGFCVAKGLGSKASDERDPRRQSLRRRAGFTARLGISRLSTSPEFSTRS